MPEPEVLPPAPNDISAGDKSAGPVIKASESYERGLALRKAGLFKPAIEQFEQASASPGLAMKAYAQIGLCHKSADRYEDAVAAFRNALKTSSGTSKETVQILYVLGRTLESLGRFSETLEAYRWIRREDPGYRDVANRINHLSSRRSSAGSRKTTTFQSGSWIGDMLKGWQGLLKSPR
jgi:tetratricopeptide (TPR) repeat protein